MSNDRIGADRESLGISFDLFEVSALQAFGGELDRGERVLDLVRDASRDVGPGRLALGREQLGDIVEGDDKTADLVIIVLGGDPYQERPIALAADQLHLRLREPVRAALRL